MDKIFKNDKVMGIVAVATLVLVAVMFYKNYKKESATVAPTATPAVEE